MSVDAEPEVLVVITGRTRPRWQKLEFQTRKKPPSGGEKPTATRGTQQMVLRLLVCVRFIVFAFGFGHRRRALPLVVTSHVVQD